MTNSKIKTSAMGFTLIELLIAVGVVAILVAFAVPTYKDYTIRSKITECVNKAAVAKLAVSEYRQTLGAWPPSLDGAGLEVVGVSQFCTGLDKYQSSSGAFAIDIKEDAIDPGLTLVEPVMTPYMTLTGAINWICTRGETSEDNLKYLPSTCRGA